MSFPHLRRPSRAHQLVDKNSRPRTGKTTSSCRSSTPQKKLIYRKSVALPSLTKNSGTDSDESDSSIVDMYNMNSMETSRSTTRRKSKCTRLPAINKKVGNARDSIQTVMDQQKFMLKFATQDNQIQKLTDNAGLIKLELDKIRVMKTPEPEMHPPQKKVGLWMASLEDEEITVPLPEFFAPTRSPTCYDDPAMRVPTPESVHLGSTILFRSDSELSNKKMVVWDDTASVSSSCSSYASSDGNSSFLYSDTEDEDKV